MRVLNALLFLLSSATPTTALDLEGRVQDLQGAPVAGAEISILGRPGKVVTDAEGGFQWTPAPPLPFEVLVVAPGGVFMKPVLIETIPADGVIVVTVAPLVAERLTVTGAAPDIEATPGAATTSLSQSEIQTRLPSNLIQALENVAGVNQVSEGQAAVPALRGLSSGRTLILIDGARVSSERRAGASATFLDPDVLESVDVARGPGSVAYGSDAFGGVISVTTRKVAPGAPLAVRASGTLGAGVPEGRAAADVSKGFARGSVLASVHVRDADDWSSPEGEVFNSGYNDSGVLFRVAQAMGGGYFSGGYQGDFGRDIERPRNNSSTVRFFYPTEDSHRVTAEYDKADVGGFDEIGLHGFWGDYGQVTDQDRFATATTPRSVERADIAANDYQFRSYARRPLGGAKLELGLDLNGRYGLHALDIAERYDLSGALVGTTTNVSVDSARRHDSAAYASVEAPVADWLTLAGGVRGDYITTQNEGGYYGDRSTGNGAVSGYGTVTVGSFGGVSFMAQLARGFRDPVLSDRYYRGPSGRGFITGNPDLEPETSLQADAGVRYTSRRLRGAAYVYQYRIYDLIERYNITVDDFYFRNRGTARLRGFELEGQADLGGGFSMELAFQAARGKALDGDTYLDGITPETVSVLGRKAFGARGFAQARLAWFAEDERPGPTERVVNGYTLLDLGGGVSFGRHLEIRALGRNLFDRTYFASQDVRAVSAPGAQASVTAVVRF